MLKNIVIKELRNDEYNIIGYMVTIKDIEIFCTSYALEFNTLFLYHDGITIAQLQTKSYTFKI